MVSKGWISIVWRCCDGNSTVSRFMSSGNGYFIQPGDLSLSSLQKICKDFCEGVST